jgi:Fe-S-cluster-containing hydrogenase component 2
MVFEMPSCGGCRTCEIACSYKHTGEFAPFVSSLKILDREDGDGYDVFLSEGAAPEGLSCDGCQERDIPLCVEYCHEPDDLTKIIFDFLAYIEKSRKLCPEK